jgi:hypothetical protein
MGQKIHPLSFRQHNSLKAIVDINLKNLNFRTRFQQEIELRRILLKLFNTNQILSQDISIEQSLRSGFVVRVKFLAFKNITSLFLPFQKKKQVFKNILTVPSSRQKKQYFLRKFRRTSASSLQAQTFSSYRHFLLKRSKILLAFSSLGQSGWFPVSFLFTSPALRFFSNKSFVRLFSNLFRSLYRQRSQKKFFLLVLLGLLACSSGTWASLMSSVISKSFFRTRKHMPIFRFYKKLFTLIYQTNSSFSDVAGLSFSVSGRFDKRPRTKRYQLTKGSLLKQQIKGKINYGSAHGVTKNGVFGIKFFVRLK